MTNTLKWRLGKLPTSDEVLKLVNDKIITKEEARDILFNEETEVERDIESYKQEIKFLRELIDNLSKNNRNTLLTEIRYIEKPVYRDWNWYQPYVTLCNAVSSGYSGSVISALNTDVSGTTYLSGSGTVCMETGSKNFIS